MGFLVGYVDPEADDAFGWMRIRARRAGLDGEIPGVIARLNHAACRLHGLGMARVASVCSGRFKGRM